MPAWERRLAAQPPEAPDPTTITSKCCFQRSCINDYVQIELAGHSTSTMAILMLPRKGEHIW